MGEHFLDFLATLENVMGHTEGLLLEPGEDCPCSCELPGDRQPATSQGACQENKYPDSVPSYPPVSAGPLG